MHCIYLHGFASGPSSTKAAFFADRIRQHGWTIDVPDLNVPSFESLTLSSQLNVVEELLSSKDKVLLIGSSMGGLIATIAATRNRNVAGLILLAPGFGLSRRWQSLWGEDAMSRWARDGYLEVFHHALKATARLGFQFVTDALLYQSENIVIYCPTLVLHGRNDEIVPVIESINFHAANPDLVQLEVMEDDHQLLNTLEDLWGHSIQFLDDLKGSKIASCNHGD